MCSSRRRDGTGCGRWHRRRASVTTCGSVPPTSPPSQPALDIYRNVPERFTLIAGATHRQCTATSRSMRKKGVRWHLTDGHINNSTETDGQLSERRPAGLAANPTGSSKQPTGLCVASSAWCHASLSICSLRAVVRYLKLCGGWMPSTDRRSVSGTGCGSVSGSSIISALPVWRPEK